MPRFLYRASTRSGTHLRLFVTNPSVYLFGVLVGIDIVQLYYPGRTFTSVEEKPKVEVPALRILQKGTPLALPNYPQAEKVELDQKEARLKGLEKYMEECANPTVNFAVEVLDVTMSEQEEELKHESYHEYAMFAIKNAEKRLRENALVFHPDRRLYARSNKSVSSELLFSTLLCSHGLL